MSKAEIYKYWKDLPGWAKGIIITAGIFGTYRAVRWISVKLKKDEQKETIKSASSEVKNLYKQGIRVSYPDAQFEVFAETLREAFDGWGTSEGAVYSVFAKMKNDADVYKLIEVYGTRGYYGTMENFFGGLFGDANVHRTLPAAISSELGSSELAKLNRVLETNKIKFRFS